MTGVDPAAFIRARLPVMPVPGVPELRLHRAVPASGVGTLADARGGPPYWAYSWAGGLALARYVLDRPAIVAGRQVLDLGTGSGLVAIAAAKAGAAAVTAVDTDPIALAAVRLNAAENGVAVTPLCADLLDGPPPAADLVLAGDLFYEAGLAGRTTRFLDRCAAAGVAVLVGDPWRAPLPVARLRELARYDMRETGGTVRPSGAFAFLPAIR